MYKSPFVASITQSCIAAIIILLFAFFAGTNNPNQQAYLELYGLMAILGTMVVIAAQALVSLAIIVYFHRVHPEETNWWTTRIAPAIAFAAQAFVLYLLLSNITFLGGGFGLANWLAPIALVIILIGLAGALYLKTRDPSKYLQIGRLIYEGVPEGTLAAYEGAQEGLSREGV